MKYVSLLTVIATVLFFYSVSAQETAPGDSISLTSAKINAADSQLVTRYIYLSRYYLQVDPDSSVYWAEKAIAFSLLKNNKNYLQNGVQVLQQAENLLTQAHQSEQVIASNKSLQQQQTINVLTIALIILLLIGISFLIVYIRKDKNLKAAEADNEEYESKIKELEHDLHDAQRKFLDLKQTQKDFQSNYNNLQKANDIKDKLIPMIAHDIRSPLAALQNTLSLTRDNIINPEEFQKLSFALEADLFNLRGMLDNMLLWAREQMFEIKVNKIKFDLCETVRDVILMYRNNLVTKNITLHNYMPSHLEVTTDKEIIAAVFRNLFSNAVKFTAENKNIYISQIFLNGKAYISVKDEGKGMAAETIQKINNKEHISTRGTANEKGTGLGLLFSKEMINKLGEAFDITSYSEQGTSVTFSVSL